MLIRGSLGPLDVGELSYHPGARGANGVDHFVLALAVENGAILVHDPAGYPAVPIDVDALSRAWRADLIGYRKGVYRRWHSPVRVQSPTPRQISDAAIRFFQRDYGESRAMNGPGVTVGPEATKQLATAIRNEELQEGGLKQLKRFTLALGVRRALDYSWYFHDFYPELAEPKSRYAWHLGRVHSAAVQRQWGPLADHLMRFADLEHKSETVLAKEAARPPGSYMNGL